MTNIEIVQLGHIDRMVDFKQIQNHRSKLFRISSLKCISNLPEPKHDRLTIIEALTDDQIKEIMGKESDAIRIGIINYYLEGNYYVRMLGNRTAVVSIKVVKDVLPFESISIETFIIKNIYEIATIYHEMKGKYTVDAYSIPHTETRGCLFDMNGEVTDVVYNTEHPIICNECETRLSQKELPQGYLTTLKKELKSLKKPIIKRIELFIHKYPLFSLLISVVFTILINIFSNVLYNMLLTHKSTDNRETQKCVLDNKINDSTLHRK